ncbi:peptidase M20 domain-containing protein 2 [Favolaschia claudopus]|uniref:Peptidase M20 domain-containing protein 2 n=1 Tax=Favolaschia claudopus TaxID=2862362 RepID=A0AAW0CVS6_9AGAR
MTKLKPELFQAASKAPGTVWRPDDTEPTVPACPDTVYREDILAAIEQTIKSLDKELRSLSLDVHSHPEIGYEEHRTHDVLTAFMESHGFNVTRHYALPTAWLSEFSNGSGGRTIGINSEMDALKGIGHACGHNLIAISGIAVACAIKAVFEKFSISGRIQLLGTPAEEGGLGKLKLLDAGCYKDMAACIMCHPAPGPKGSLSLTSCLAMDKVEVEYFGHTAHAALSPWEGINALDAAVLAYNNISALRQQLKPTHRVHGVFEGRDWAPNIIPDYAKYICYVRAPTVAERQETMNRVVPCFHAAALASGCEVKVTFTGASADIRQNKVLGDEVAHIVRSKYGDIDYEWGIKGASTDFGDVTYGFPARSASQLRNPTVAGGGNHTPEFADAAATEVAHYACLDASKALAAVGVRVIIDDHFYRRVKKSFDDDVASRDFAA